jgi:hypothetical protein
MGWGMRLIGSVGIDGHDRLVCARVGVRGRRLGIGICGGCAIDADVTRGQVLAGLAFGNWAPHEVLKHCFAHARHAMP